MVDFKYIFMLFTVVFLGCEQNSIEDTTSDSYLAEQAKVSFRKALQAQNERSYWLAISSYDESIRHYNLMDSTKEDYYLYLAYRFRANMLNVVRLHDQASISIDSALSHLDKVDSLPPKKDKELERISSLAYKADYKRSDGDFRNSNDILLSLLKSPSTESNQEIRSQLLNQVGLNYTDLGDYESAYQKFNEVLSNPYVEPNKKAYYLNNRSFVAFKLSNKRQAYEDISEAIGIVTALNDTIGQIRFKTYKGEYLLSDSEYMEAEENLAFAMEMGKNIEEYPDLFKVYRLRAVVAAVLGNQEFSNEFNNQYESLLEKNYETMRRYKANEELAILTAKMERIEIDKTKRTYLSQIKLSNTAVFTMAVLLAVIIGFTLLVLAAWRRKAHQFNRAN